MSGIRGIRPSRLDGHIVTILDKPYFGEVGLVVGKGRAMPEGRRRVTDSTGRGKVGWRFGTYKVFLCDPKWGSRLVNIRTNRVVDGRHDLYSNVDRVFRLIDSGDYPEDRMTKVMLEEALDRKVNRLRIEDVRGLGLDEEDTGLLLSIREGGRSWP